jgi:hypothetical protein
LSSVVECPCGTKIQDSSEYALLFLKKELLEIDILCPNEICHLRELGYVRFEKSGGEALFREASFYPPFVTWNSTQLGRELAQNILKRHLKEIVTTHIDWREVAQVMKPCSTHLGTNKRDETVLRSGIGKEGEGGY